jgi:hypothetical protein
LLKKRLFLQHAQDAQDDHCLGPGDHKMLKMIRLAASGL